MEVSTKPLFLISCLWLTLFVGTSQSQGQSQWYTSNSNNYYNPTWRQPLPLSLPQSSLSYYGRYYPTLHQQPQEAANNRRRVVVVDQSGRGDFRTIQSAINSVPENNRFWVQIQINAGIYREKVTIPMYKPYILLKGQGHTTTKIVWDDHQNTAQSPTFAALSDHLVVKSLGFVNSYNYPSSNNRNRYLPAVAALVDGDKISFHQCGFFGFQDTLWDNRGRHYFNNCTIEGSVDFIFGRAQSIYEGCDIKVLAPGFVTAHARETPQDPSGFVFKGCSISGVGPSYLGRPWRAHARVLYYRSYFSDVIDPTGWDTWNVPEDRVVFAEFDNTGPGADMSKRVGWEKHLTRGEWERMTSMSFISEEKWLQQQPYNF